MEPNRHSKDLKVLPENSIVNITRIANFKDRVRGFAENEQGWISMCNIETGYLWVDEYSQDGGGNMMSDNPETKQTRITTTKMKWEPQRRITTTK
eukprot:UN16908